MLTNLDKLLQQEKDGLWEKKGSYLIMDYFMEQIIISKLTRGFEF